MELGWGLLLVLGWATLARSVDEAVLTINTKKWLHIVSDKFLSLTLDPTMLLYGQELSSGTVRTLNMAKGLAPAYLRLGGPDSNRYSFERMLPPGEAGKNHSITEAHWIVLNHFAQETGLDLIVCLNPTQRSDGVWDPRNSLELISFSDRMGYKLGYQLGYELQRLPGDIPASQLGRDVARLRRVLDAFPRYESSLILGPDLTSFRTPEDAEFLMDFFQEAAPALSAITWHPRFSGMMGSSEESLEEHGGKTDSLASDKEDLTRTLSRMLVKKPLWIAESEGVNSMGRFRDALSWAHRLGMAARLGVQVVLRQPGFPGLFQPTPDYWVSLLHKALVGATVLDSRVTSSNATHIHAFSQCTSPQQRRGTLVAETINYEAGAVTVFVVNTLGHKTKLHLRASSWGRQMDEEVHQYLLTAADRGLNSRKVLLNSQLLSLERGGSLPVLSPKVFRVGRSLSVTVPRNSVGFWVLPQAKVRPCMAAPSPNVAAQHRLRPATLVPEGIQVRVDVDGTAATPERRFRRQLQAGAYHIPGLPVTLYNPGQASSRILKDLERRFRVEDLEAELRRKKVMLRGGLGISGESDSHETASLGDSFIPKPQPSEEGNVKHLNYGRIDREDQSQASAEEFDGHYFLGPGEFSANVPRPQVRPRHRDELWEVESGVLDGSMVYRTSAEPGRESVGPHGASYSGAGSRLPSTVESITVGTGDMDDVDVMRMKAASLKTYRRNGSVTERAKRDLEAGPSERDIPGNFEADISNVPLNQIDQKRFKQMKSTGILEDIMEILELRKDVDSIHMQSPGLEHGTPEDHGYEEVDHSTKMLREMASTDGDEVGPRFPSRRLSDRGTSANNLTSQKSETNNGSGVEEVHADQQDDLSLIDSFPRTLTRLNGSHPVSRNQRKIPAKESVESCGESEEDIKTTHEEHSEGRGESESSAEAELGEMESEEKTSAQVKAKGKMHSSHMKLKKHHKMTEEEMSSMESDVTVKEIIMLEDASSKHTHKHDSHVHSGESVHPVPETCKPTEEPHGTTLESHPYEVGKDEARPRKGSMPRSAFSSDSLSPKLHVLKETAGLRKLPFLTVERIEKLDALKHRRLALLKAKEAIGLTNLGEKFVIMKSVIDKDTIKQKLGEELIKINLEKEVFDRNLESLKIPKLVDSDVDKLKIRVLADKNILKAKIGSRLRRSIKTRQGISILSAANVTKRTVEQDLSYQPNHYQNDGLVSRERRPPMVYGRQHDLSPQRVYLDMRTEDRATGQLEYVNPRHSVGQVSSSDEEYQLMEARPLMIRWDRDAIYADEMELYDGLENRDVTPDWKLEDTNGVFWHTDDDGSVSSSPEMGDYEVLMLVPMRMGSQRRSKRSSDGEMADSPMVMYDEAVRRTPWSMAPSPKVQDRLDNTIRQEDHDEMEIGVGHVQNEDDLKQVAMKQRIVQLTGEIEHNIEDLTDIFESTYAGIQVERLPYFRRMHGDGTIDKNQRNGLLSLINDMKLDIAGSDKNWADSSSVSKSDSTNKMTNTSLEYGTDAKNMDEVKMFEEMSLVSESNSSQVGQAEEDYNQDNMDHKGDSIEMSGKPAGVLGSMVKTFHAVANFFHNLGN